MVLLWLGERGTQWGCFISNVKLKIKSFSLLEVLKMLKGFQIKIRTRVNDQKTKENGDMCLISSLAQSDQCLYHEVGLIRGAASMVTERSDSQSR